MKTTQITGRVTVLDIVHDLPGLLTQEETNFRGSKRLFTQQVVVRNTELFQRLATEVPKGATIEATIVTEWHKDHSEIYLADYSLLLSLTPIAEHALTT